MSYITYGLVLVVGFALGYFFNAQQNKELIAKLQNDLDENLKKIASLLQKENDQDKQKDTNVVEDKYFRDKVIVKNDLCFIAGIDVSAITFLNSRGIHTWQDLANSSVEQLSEIIISAKEHVNNVISSMSIEELREKFLSVVSNYDKYDPSTWPAQAKLAIKEDWDTLGDLLDGKISARDII